MLEVVYDNTTMTVDLNRTGGKNFVVSEKLDTAVLLSLFTRRLALEDDELPNPNGDRGGWWGDDYLPDEGDKFGSRLWLLNRSTLDQSTLNLAKVYAEEALRWLVDDGIAKSVDVIVEIYDVDMMAFQVTITKPNDPAGPWVTVWHTHLEDL